MFPQKSHVIQTLIGIALVFYVFNNPSSAAQIVNQAIDSAATFFGSLG